MTATTKKPIASGDLNDASFRETKGRAYHLANERFYAALAIAVLETFNAGGKSQEMAMLAVKRIATRGVDRVARDEARAFCDRNGIAF